MIILGISIYFFIRCILTGFYTIDQNERAILTSFGKVLQINDLKTTSGPMGMLLSDEEKQRYSYPQCDVVGPGLHFKWPWQKVYKTSIATETVSMAYDPSRGSVNNFLEAVTKDQLNINLTGQIRFRVAEQNLYAYFFGILDPMSHIMGFFVSILRERIATFGPDGKSVEHLEVAVRTGAGAGDSLAQAETVSINDLRKNLRELNDMMVKECLTSSARYGITLEASLITSIDPPSEVEAALAAINTAHNNVSSEISLARATADQTIVQSKRAVEIETLKAQAEIEPLMAMSRQLLLLKAKGPDALKNFVRNNRLEVVRKAKRIIKATEL